MDKHTIPRLPNDNHVNNQRGYITLVAVLIISAIAISTTVSLALLGSDHALMSNGFGKQANTRALADACAEVALQSLGLDPTYTTSETTQIDFGVDGDYCQYTVQEQIADTGDTQRVIESIGHSNQSFSRARVTIFVGPVETYPSPVLASWTPVADF